MPPTTPRKNAYGWWFLAPVAGGAAWVVAQKAVGADTGTSLAGGAAFLVIGAIVSYWRARQHHD